MLEGVEKRRAGVIERDDLSTDDGVVRKFLECGGDARVTCHGNRFCCAIRDARGLGLSLR